MPRAKSGFRSGSKSGASRSEAGTGELRVGRLTEAFRGRELSDEEKGAGAASLPEAVKVEVGAFFDGVGPDSSDAKILAIAAKHPAFDVLPVD
jgi:hypothetical protein